jgi:2-polyprenyl-6-methoxyphenol hydroxylase-like FAD-dependent oxidoreductase
MKINIIGGGPAGMYFAILMKKTNPSHEITIYERNGPTFALQTRNRTPKSLIVLKPGTMSM